MNTRHKTRKTQPKPQLESLFKLARDAFERKEDAAACKALEDVLKLAPEHLTALKTLGVIRLGMGDYEPASRHFAQAVLKEPTEPSNYLNFGICLHNLGQLDEALACLDEALKLKKDYPAALSNKGAIFRDKNEFEKALACYQAAIELDNSRYDDYLNYALVLSDLGLDTEALEICDIAIKLGAQEPHGHFQRGYILAKMMRSNEAELAYLKALELKPNFPEAHWNLSHIYLRRGEYSRGWELFESRWKTKNTKLVLKHPGKPLWLGDTSINGKTILLTTEQGIGDTIQFSRYALLFEGLGAKVVLESQKPIANLLKSMAPNITVVPEGENLPQFDYYCPQMSLPYLMGTKKESVPCTKPYLFADPVKSECWAKRIGHKAKPRIGLVWCGGFHADRPETWALNKRRNIPLEKFKLLKAFNFEFFSLQKGEAAVSEMFNLCSQGWSGPQILDYTNELEDFSDTAGLIEQLDLIISVDTSTAHLGAAMGKPVWLLNRFDSCWRWLEGESSSPWYPSMKIFTQPSPGDWDSVISSVYDEFCLTNFNNNYKNCHND